MLVIKNFQLFLRIEHDMAAPKDPIKYQQWIARLSAGQKRRFQDPKELLKHSISMKGCKWSKESKKQASISHTGKKHSTEARANMSVAKIKYYQDSENVKKHKEACTFEVRAKMSIAHKGKKHSVEHIAKNSVAKRGNKNPNWIDGSSNVYPPEWTEALREFIRERDGRVCQLCAKTEKGNGQKLDIHHIDYNKDNCVEYNLISLCIPCHMKTNKNREQCQIRLGKYNAKRMEYAVQSI